MYQSCGIFVESANILWAWHVNHSRMEFIMNTIEHVQLAPDGRIVIPATARKELGLKSGDTLVLESDGTSLLIRSVDVVLHETQEYFRQFLKPGESVVDELIADRRAEAVREEDKLQAMLTLARRE
jgi:AbrB family looped-hinge helix DNA binding protein